MIIKILEKAKKIAYSTGTFEMIEFSLICFNKIIFTNQQFKQNFLKKLVMKIIQLILLTDDVYEYTKEGLAVLISQKYNNKSYQEYSLYYLFRETRGQENYVFVEFLFDEYKNIYEKYKNMFNQRDHIVFLKDDLLSIGIPNLPAALFKQFLASPTILQEQFEQEYLKLYPDSSINQICELVTCENNDFIEFLKINNLFDKFYIVAQRSDEWFALLKYHSCGTGKVAIGETLVERYHLFRGIIGEYIIQNKIKIILNNILGSHDYQFINVGMIAESKNQDSLAVSPDGLLWSPSTNKIIFIEVKCLKNSGVSRNYFREFSLSKLQLSRAQSILNYPGVYKNLSIICWFDNENLHVDVFDIF